MFHACSHFGRRFVLGETHLFAIPLLAAPAHASGIDDAGSGATAPWVFAHKSPLGLAVGAAMIRCLSVIKLHLGASQCAMFSGATLHAHAPQAK